MFKRCNYKITRYINGEKIMTNTVDKDPEVKKDIEELEALAESIRSDAYDCRATDIFLDNIGLIGGLHRKYTKFTFLPSSSESAKRFDSAIRKAKDAKRKFVGDCICQQRK
jgi:hypothetical protein